MRHATPLDQGTFDRRAPRALAAVLAGSLIALASIATAAESSRDRDAGRSDVSARQAPPAGEDRASQDAKDDGDRHPDRGQGWSRDRRGELRDRLREHFDRRGDGRGFGGEAAAGFVPETLTDEDLAEVVSVAREISPEWGEKLAQMLEEDPEGLRESVSTKARRIWLLVELKRQRPALYRIRVEEIRLQGRMRDLVRRHREAKAAQDETRRADLETQIRAAAEQAVDLQLRGRAEELAAMAEAVERMLADLTLEGRQRDERIERLVQRMLAGGRPGRGRDGTPDPALSSSRGDAPSDAAPSRTKRGESDDD